MNTPSQIKDAPDIDDVLDRLASTALRVKRDREQLLSSLKALLAWIDEEDDNREGTLICRDPTCNECTQGCTPNNLDKGLCPFHGARAALRKAGA